MILILADSLRYDFAEKYLKGVFPEESWSKFRAVETLTPIVLASIATGKTPQETGVKFFTDKVNDNACNDVLFDHFDSYVTVSRLLGNGPGIIPPARRHQMKMLHPIVWNAESNHDDDVLEYVGRKYSKATDDWWDLIFYHSWLTHGPWGIDNYGPAELPCVKNTDNLMRRQSLEENKRWYKIGIDDFRVRLREIRNITNNKETIIITADHGEDLGEGGGRGHYAGSDLEELRTVPIWINRKEEIPSDINHTNLKDWVIKMYNKYEKNTKKMGGTIVST
jgi:hypothetical protein